MPFGLCNAPSTFQRCMELLLSGLQWKTLLIYLDDVIVHSATFEDHIERLGEVLSRLRKAGLKLKPSKCHLMQSEVLFLGHVVGQEGVRTNPKLVKAVSDWKRPTDPRQVQQFLGLCNYYRRFVPHFGHIAHPLYQLTEKGMRFEWTEECEAAFDQLKVSLTHSPVLAYPRPGGKYTLDTDASNIGIGAVLSQEQDGEERVIAYASKRLDKRQRRYCVTRRELLACVTFIQQFRHYLLGQEFDLRTDHNSLRWLFSFKEPQDQLARWLEVLAQYRFRILHRAGTKHGNADALSRKYCDPQQCDCFVGGCQVHTLPCGGCKYCQRQHESWKEFQVETDDVIPLATRRIAGPDNESAEDDVIQMCNPSKRKYPVFTTIADRYDDIRIHGELV